MRVIRENRCTVSAIFTAIAAALIVAPGTAFAQAKDDLWEVTMKMEMPGMPMAMAPQVHRLCVAKNHKDEDLIPTRGNCRVLDSKRNGNRLTYTMACTGEQAMTVSGDMTYGTNSYEGRMQMKTTGGDAMEMSQTFAGERVGDCTATK